MRILISGCGLAGMTTAYWLHQFGFKPVIIEQAPALRRDGYGLDFFGTGYDVAERMAVINTLAPQQIPAEYVAYVDENNTRIATLDMDLMRQVMHGKYFPLMHWTLEETLYNAIADDVEIRFGTTLTAVSQTPDAVTVTFNDGASETFDLLIGADGAHSLTRRLAFGPEKAYGRFLGYNVACYALPDQYGVGHAWNNYTEPGRQAGVYCSDKPGELITLFMWETENEAYVPPADRLETLRRAFDGMGWITPQLLADAPDSENIFMDTVTQIQMPGWANGRVALVGDAAYCLTLISGQGASMALGGAYLLAEALRDCLTYQDAFIHYEHQLRPHIEQRQDNARDFAKSFVPGSELGLKVQKVMMKIVLREAFTGVLRKQFGADSILQSQTLRRLPQSHGQVIGYALNGKLHDTDYQTLNLDVESVLQTHDSVHLLLRLENFAGIELRGLWDDLQFGREHGRDIGKLAIVGDGRWADWLAKASRPFYAHEARHFPTADSAAAWDWVRSER